MRAWRILDPGKADSLTQQPSDARRPGPHDVVVLVRAVALNHRDLLLLNGRVSQPVPPGRIPCSDAAGEVIATGDAVSVPRPGDRVMTTFAPEWTHGRLTATAAASVLGSVRVDGVLATRVTLPASAVITMPTGWSFEEACTLPCAGLTAWHALFEESTLPTDAPVLTIGSGGVSVFALQFARRAGCDVVAVSSRAEKLGALARLGATATIDRTTTPAWGEAAKSLTGEGVAHVIDVGGQGTLSQSIRATRPGGTISLVGTLARPTPVDLTPVLMRNLRIQGIVAGSRDMLQRMLATLDADSPRPVIDRVFDFAEAPAAFGYLAEGRHVGKVIIGIQPC